MLQPLFEVRRYRGDVVTHSHDRATVSSQQDEHKSQ